MKRFCSVLGFIFLLVFLSSCVGPDGNAYQKYWWAGSLGYIYDTNPSTPSVIENDVYFPTDPGSYYMEYQAWDGSEWYMYYTITIKEGASFNTAGDDTWFEILLLSAGPALYEWDSARNIDNNEVSPNVMPPSVYINRVNERISNGKKLTEILGTDEKQYPYGSIRIEWGKIIED